MILKRPASELQRRLRVVRALSLAVPKTQKERKRIALGPALPPTSAGRSGAPLGAPLIESCESIAGSCIADVQLQPPANMNLEHAPNPRGEAVAMMRDVDSTMKNDHGVFWQASIERLSKMVKVSRRPSRGARPEHGAPLQV